jgi:hypothetical protein
MMLVYRTAHHEDLMIYGRLCRLNAVSHERARMVPLKACFDHPEGWSV